MDPFPVIIMLVTLAAIIWATYLVFRKNPEDGEGQQDDSSEGTNAAGGSGKKKQKEVEGKKSGKQKQKYVQTDQPVVKFSHPWLLSSMKGHTGNILDLDLSPNDKFLASCGDDRIVYVWMTKDLNERDHKSIRVNIPFDYATIIRWSPDSKAFVIARSEQKMLEVFKLGKKPDNSVGNITSAIQWPQDAGGRSDYIGLGIACNGKFIMSCTANGQVILRDVKGAILKKFNPSNALADPIKAKVSRCGRYVIIAGSKNIELWEVEFENAEGAVSDVRMKVLIKTKLGGPITDFDMNADTSKLTVVATDGSWIVFEFSGGRAHDDVSGKLDDHVDQSTKPVVAMSDDSRVVIVGANKGVYIFSAFNGNQLRKISDIYKRQLAFVGCSSDSKYFFTAGDNVIYVFKNASWLEETVKLLTGQIADIAQVSNAALWDRLNNELKAYKEELNKIG